MCRNDDSHLAGASALHTLEYALCAVSYVLTLASFTPGVSTASFQDPTFSLPAISCYNPEFGFSVTSTKLKIKVYIKVLNLKQSIFAYSGMKTQRPCLETKFMEINCKSPEI